MTSISNDANQAIEFAGTLLRRALELQTPHERRQQAELDRMINHDEDKATLVEMTDQAFRTHTPARVADQLVHLLDVQGVPRFFSPVEQAMLRGFQSFGEYLPGVAIPLVKAAMRRETANVILPAEPEILSEHLRNRQSHGIQMNVNLLGEAILGEGEARRRMQECIDALRLPDVRCLSVKISTLYSQISPIARKHTVTTVADRLETLLRTASHEIDPETGMGKFIYLDMEEYRDLYLTAEALHEVIQRDGMRNARVGVALQAYVPDSYGVMQRLIEWSAARVRGGGAPLTIRLVKGANLEMERVEASIGGYPQAPYQRKIDTDANYKRMLRELIEAAANGAIHVGLASHNLFDVALGMLWANQLDVQDELQIEMLEGMANHQRRAISGQNRRVLLYAPACRREGFLNAIGYLIRRLDENTGPQNFLRHCYRLTTDSQQFQSLAEDFRGSLDLADRVSHQPRRATDRHDIPDRPPMADHWSVLVNEPDTDWSVPRNADWAAETVEKWSSLCDRSAPRVPLMIGDERVAVQRDQQRRSLDPSRPDVISCRYQTATVEQVRKAVELATGDIGHWASTPMRERLCRLRDVAHRLRIRRGDLIGAMIADGGKTISEADAEVSEAIDFCEFYPLTAREWLDRDGLQFTPRGVVAVITPWNFPLAIPCGGVAAALACGNRVILKPAPETVLPAYLLCQAFWDCGIPPAALQFLPCDGPVAESGLVLNHDVHAVILTGGTATAKRMLRVRPSLHLLAETGGKNATIVSSMADRDLAIKHVVHSAFSHSGQKCSATSLLLLESEVFHDESFRTALADAVESLHVGSAWDLHTRLGPLIRPPNADLARGLKTLEDDESWLVVPEHVVGNPNLYRPGVKWNIRRGGFTHLNELFGPVLGVMSYSRLEEAIQIVRETGYGLTSGLETLDEREIELWKETIGAGNLYVNRPTTGAIVLRQPFGGVGLSAYGPGVKAGGPNYVLPLMHVAQSQRPDPRPAIGVADEPHDGGSIPAADALSQWTTTARRQGTVDDRLSTRLEIVIANSVQAVHSEFGLEHDSVRLVGQDNVRRYRPIRALTIRVMQTDSEADAFQSIFAAAIAGSKITLSIDPKRSDPSRALLESVADAVPGTVHPIEESDDELSVRIDQGDVLRLRLLSPADDASDNVVEACAARFVTIVDEPVVSDGRVECLRYLDEQSVSNDYHRYGNLGRRAHESRRPVL